MDTIIKRVNNNEFSSAIDDEIIMGWELKSRNDNVAILKKDGSWGSVGNHIVVFLLTIWWTGGLGNIVYAVNKRNKTKKELQIKIKEG